MARSSEPDAGDPLAWCSQRVSCVKPEKSGGGRVPQAAPKIMSGMNSTNCGKRIMITTTAITAARKGKDSLATFSTLVPMIWDVV